MTPTADGAIVPPIQPARVCKVAGADLTRAACRASASEALRRDLQLALAS